ncbi:MAG: porin [Lamprocystis purpurea]|uniref:porin n=1 Tax=Lamprocystis purpurea TaxID=61598 RepID=UPI00037B498B|nr:porin [Lamprocystis purpurea]MBV5273747.1 porin [Lamprocystis purpurea]
MTKKLLTLAVAAAMAAPAIVFAEAILYGRLNVSLDYIDVDQNATFFRPGRQVGPTFNMATFTGAGTYNAVSNLGTFSPVYSAIAPSLGSLTTTTLSNEATAAYYEAATAALNSGKTQVQAQAAGVAAANLYSTTLSTNPTVRAAQIANIERAREAAFATGGAAAGFTALDNYFSAQADFLEQNYALGRMTESAYMAEVVRLESLARIAVGSAAVGAFRTGQSFKGWGMDQSSFGPGSRVGVRGSEDLGNGLKAVYQIELGVDITNATRDTNIANGNRANGFAFRNTFVGLAGDWGTLLLGRHDTPLRLSTRNLDLFSDTLADYNGTIGFQDLRTDSNVAYMSPNWSGFQFMAAVMPQGGATLSGAFNQDEDSIAGAYSLAAMYTNGPFYGSVAYESLGAENYAVDDDNYELLYGPGMTAESDNKWRVGLGLLDWNGFSLTAIYEDREHILGAPEDADGNFFQVQAGYAFGNNMIKAMWGRADLNRCADPNNVGFRYTCPSSALGEYFADSILVQNNEKSSWAVGYDYNFSKRTTAFALYTQLTDNIEDADWSGFSIGMVHRF